MQKENIATGNPVNIWRVAGWGGALLLLLTPLVAMQFTNEVDWDETDFIVAGVIFAIVGGLVELAMRISSGWFYRFGALFAIFAGFLLVWANLAVGMIGNEDNPVNLLFIGVLLIAAIGGIMVRFRSEGLAPIMFVACAAQAGIAIIFGIMGSDPRGGIFSLILSSFWLLSAACFRGSKA